MFKVNYKEHVIAGWEGFDRSEKNSGKQSSHVLVIKV